MICRRQNTHRRRGAFTLVEAVVCSAIVGLALTAALRTVAASRMAEARVAERGRAVALAADLMTEILAQYYEEPSGGVIAFGLEALELTRDQWDDVDDYDGFTEATPAARDGTPIAGGAGWSRKVQVTWVTPDNPKAGKTTETGVKRIVVRVYHNGAWVYELTALQTRNALNQVGRDNGAVVLTDPPNGGATGGGSGGIQINIGGITIGLGLGGK